MKNLKTQIPILLLLLSSIFICTNCEESADGYKVIYYKTTGEGYVYDGTLNKPIKGAKISVETSFDRSGELFGPPIVRDTFVTDEKGYYKIRFIKKAKVGLLGDYRVPMLYAIKMRRDGPVPPSPPPNWGNGEPTFHLYERLYPEDIKDKKTITFDTVKIYPLTVIP